MNNNMNPFIKEKPALFSFIKKFIFENIGFLLAFQSVITIIPIIFTSIGYFTVDTSKVLSMTDVQLTENPVAIVSTLLYKILTYFVGFLLAAAVGLLISNLLSALRDAYDKKSVFELENTKMIFTVKDAIGHLASLFTNKKTYMIVIKAAIYVFLQAMILTIIISVFIALATFLSLQYAIILIIPVFAFAMIYTNLSTANMILRKDTFWNYFKQPFIMINKFPSGVFNLIVIMVLLIIVTTMVTVISVGFISSFKGVAEFFAINVLTPYLLNIYTFFVSIFSIILVRYYLEYYELDVEWNFDITANESTPFNPFNIHKD